ncbi:DUF1294 domain-containing protein [Trichococcus ilyis]|jgi:uncharacterized membrane protein YsdA (DUF1294 family)|uniref:Uncharacterized membrane protein YsdA, DUF1294 family n=1 Tax=Trichococcus ilyis TaxID=640938 RepID=A0A143Y847_9LACT|nr:DUF1294 domain-containing protein [Trichococcus ilyis]CZQ81870.1 Hypothetical protein TR210_174 [Trichococcus ilyis]SEI51856.1 Uncharacterized membrane protein YsdA, DUF1294 family [Trichococcus ilyis]
MRNALLIYFVLVNVLLFILMGIDKKKARQNAWRIPERNLLLLGLFGGGLGGLSGMHHFRHKTKHPRFKLVYVLGTLLSGLASCFFL